MLRIDFYNAIAQILTHPEKVELDIKPNAEEELAIRHLLDMLGRHYYAPPCTEIVDAPNQVMFNNAFKYANSQPIETHENCVCVRSEMHTNFHRCKHGYYTG